MTSILLLPLYPCRWITLRCPRPSRLCRPPPHPSPARLLCLASLTGQRWTPMARTAPPSPHERQAQVRTKRRWVAGRQAQMGAVRRQAACPLTRVALPASPPLAGNLLQSFPLSRLLKSSMQLSGKALCELAVKGSTLNNWSLLVSPPTASCMKPLRVAHVVVDRPRPFAGQISIDRQPHIEPGSCCTRACLCSGDGSGLGPGLPQHCLRHRVRMPCTLPICSAASRCFRLLLLMLS